MRSRTIVLLTSLLATIIGSSFKNAKLDQVADDWKLPMKGDFIQYDYSDTLNNKTKELCEFYATQQFLVNVNNLIHADLSKKSGEKLLSTSDYFMTVTSLWGENMNPQYSTSPCKSDTLYGSMYIQMAKQSMKINGIKQDVSKITAKIRVIFEGKNNIHIRVRGFTVTKTKSKYNASGVETDIIDLESIYNPILAEENPKKSDTNIFKDLNMMMESFHTCLMTQLKKDIKVLED